MTNNWNELAANILKSEIKRKGLTYERLREKLLEVGIKETASSIKTKMSRGTFQFTFFLQCAAVIGMKTLRLDELSSVP